MIVDVNGVSDVGITSFANRRTDTRTDAEPAHRGAGVLRVSVPEAVGGKTVLGQLTVDRVAERRLRHRIRLRRRHPDRRRRRHQPVRPELRRPRSPVASNRLIVKADNDGDVCFYTLQPAAMIVDINAVSDVGISSFPNYRIDTRSEVLPAGSITTVGVPIWPPYTPLPGARPASPRSPASRPTRPSPTVRSSP